MKSLYRALLVLALFTTALACGGKQNRQPATTQGAAGGATRPTTAPTRTAPPVMQPTIDEPDDEALGNFSDPDNIFGRTLDEIGRELGVKPPNVATKVSNMIRWAKARGIWPDEPSTPPPPAV